MNGIIPLYKPKGMTSHDCVNKVRRILNTKKVGHTGTLDPDVDGVLPLCIGKATKIAEYVTAQYKVYEGEISIGKSTTTEDASGEVIKEVSVDKPILRAEIEKVFQQFIGTITQVPPMFSAVKINGKRLYEYARKGIEIERPARKIEILELSLLSTSHQFNGPNPLFRFRVHCSKGTYVRTLAVDIGKELGYPAHMSDLTRIASGSITLDECVSLEELEKHKEQDNLKNCFISIGEVLSYLPSLTVNDEIEAKVKNGAVLQKPEEMQSSSFTIYNKQGICLAIYQDHPKKPQLMKPEKML